ncbi:MAG: F0F1 ATP synthase subunit A [Oscillospiraceae bacterium]|jgi:F-type H+-transporting ATPase subunit a|nr:F0F1 ATP synthase subunit A [Oscillospiraceae bacterium]
MKKASVWVILIIALAVYIAGLIFATPAEDFGVDGAQVVFELELFGITSDPSSLLSTDITTSVTVQIGVTIFLGLLFFFLGRNLKVRPDSKKQLFAEYVVGFFNGTVKDSMGEKYMSYAPFMAAIFCFSMFNSLTSILGLRGPTADISVVLTWGLMTAFLVHRNRLKSGGIWRTTKSFFEPVAPMLPLNILNDITTPLTHSFRHFGNILAGTIIMSIFYWALGYFAFVVPAAFSLYFDLFGAFIQAFIFMTLATVYILISDLSPPEEQS